MNTGGPAFPQPNHLIETDRGREEARGWMADSGMTLLDWMAGQALEKASKGSEKTAEDIAKRAYYIAEAMIAEKARREEAMRSTFEKPGVATAMAVHEAFNKDHSPDGGKMAALEAANRELVEALEKFLEAGVGFSTHPVVQYDAVVMARAALSKAKGVA